MDRILSARVNESVIRRIGALAQRLGITRKAVIENAIEMYAEKHEIGGGVDVFEQTSGAWRRPPSEKTLARARKAFENSMRRHKK